MGRACLTGPFFSTAVLSALPILAAGSAELKKEFLPGIAKGEKILALALTEPSATYEAAGAVEQGIPCSYQVSVAKAKVNEAYKHSTRMGVQLHGAIGMTRDHDMGLYYRRSRQAALLFGDTDSCREKVAQELSL
jgi:alkylation response protein AidB-like acyl-CoA dehydrogenase